MIENHVRKWHRHNRHNCLGICRGQRSKKESTITAYASFKMLCYKIWNRPPNILKNYLKHFQLTSPSSWITRAVGPLWPRLVLPHCWSPRMRDCWLTAATLACLSTAGAHWDHSDCGRWWLAEGSKVRTVAADSAGIPLVHSRRK